MTNLKPSLRKRVLRRDSHKCQLCDAGGELEAHHIDGDYANDALNNLTTLCKQCHQNVHHNPTTEPEQELADKILPRSERKTGDQVAGSVGVPPSTHKYRCSDCGFEMPSINGPEFCPDCGVDKPPERV